MTQTTRVALVILGQFVSQLGYSLTGFAFGVLLFKMSNRVTDLSLLYFFQLLPVILIILPSGIIVDKFSQKKIIILSDLVAIIFSLFLIYKLQRHDLIKYQLYLYVMVCSAFATMQGLAITTLVGITIPKDQRSKFNIFLNLRQAIPRLIAPVFAGLWITFYSTTTLVIIDICTSFIAISLTLLLSEKPIVYENIQKIVSFKDYKSCVKELLNKTPLLWSLACVSFSLCAISLMGVYILPIALMQANAAVAGNIIAVGGLGALIAGILIAFSPVKKLKIENFIPLSLAFQGLVLFFGLLSPHIFFISLILFIYFLINPCQRGFSYTLWENATEENSYGKVLSIKGIALQLVGAVIFLIAGPLIDDVITPFLNKLPRVFHFSLMRDYSDNSVLAMVLVLMMVGLAQFLFGFYVYQQKKLSDGGLLNMNKYGNTL